MPESTEGVSELSIVGPRPERPEIAAQYCEEMPEFALRLQANSCSRLVGRSFRNTITVAPDKYAVWVIFEAGLVQNALLAAERQYIGVDTAPTQVRHSCITVCVWLICV